MRSVYMQCNYGYVIKSAAGHLAMRDMSAISIRLSAATVEEITESDYKLS